MASYRPMSGRPAPSLASGLIIREITCQKTVERRASGGGTEGEGTDIGEQGGEHVHMEGAGGAAGKVTCQRD